MGRRRGARVALTRLVQRARTLRGVRQPSSRWQPRRGSQMARLGGFVNKLLTLTTGLGLTVATIAPVAQAQPTDTTRISTEPLFTKRDAWIALGFAAGTVALYPADRYFARKLQTPH